MPEIDGEFGTLDHFSIASKCCASCFFSIPGFPDSWGTPWCTHMSLLFHIFPGQCPQMTPQLRRKMRKPRRSPKQNIKWILCSLSRCFSAACLAEVVQKQFLGAAPERCGASAVCRAGVSAENTKLVSHPSQLGERQKCLSRETDSSCDNNTK